MRYNLAKYGQYKNDIFNKLDIIFIRGAKLLDVGCGDGSDAEIFIKEFGLKTFGIDIYEHENIKKLENFTFKKASILNIPYADNYFDYVFLHDVLHHLDEEYQSQRIHKKALSELRRVCKRKGLIIIIEANRYNLLLYLHMVLIRQHNHFKQSYFYSLIQSEYYSYVFKHFEAHLYPRYLLFLFKMYELFIENIPFLRPFLAYNVAIVKMVD